MVSGHELYRQADARRAAFYDQVRQRESAQWNARWHNWISLVRDVDQLGVLDGIVQATGQEIQIVPHRDIETVTYPPNRNGLHRLAAWVQTPTEKVQDETLRISVYGDEGSVVPEAVIVYKRGHGVAIDGKLIVDEEEHKERSEVAHLTRNALEAALTRFSP